MLCFCTLKKIRTRYYNGMKYLKIIIISLFAIVLTSCASSQEEVSPSGDRSIASSDCVKGKAGLESSEKHMALLKAMGGNSSTPFGIWLDARDHRKKMLEFKNNGSYVLHDADKPENEGIKMTIDNVKKKKFKKIEKKSGSVEFCIKNGKLVAKVKMGLFSQDFPLGENGNLKRIKTKFMQWDFDYRKKVNY